MVTAVTALGADALSAAQGVGMPASAPAAPAPQLSDIATEALQGLGRMHANFDAGARAVETQMASPAQIAGQISGASDIAMQLQASQQAMQVAMKLQGQIMQFSMATSISSSLGNNLNSFLKGA